MRRSRPDPNDPRLADLRAAATAVVREATSVDWNEHALILVHPSAKKMLAAERANGATVVDGVALRIVMRDALQAMGMERAPGTAQVMIGIEGGAVVIGIEIEPLPEGVASLAARRAKINAPRVQTANVRGVDEMTMNAAATARWIYELELADVSRAEWHPAIERVKARVRAALAADELVGRRRSLDDLIADVCHVRELDRAMGVAAEGRGALTMDRMFGILCGEATH